MFAVFRLLRLTSIDNFFFHYLKIVAILFIPSIFLPSFKFDINFYFLLAFYLFYQIFGYVVNDISDIQLDSLVPGTRNPLASGDMIKRDAGVIASISLVLAFSSLLLLPSTIKVIGMLSLLLALTYSWGVRAKFVPFLDLAYHGVLLMLPMIMVCAMFGPFDGLFIMLSSLTFLAGLIPQIMQEIRDHNFDRLRGRTTVTLLGKKKSLILCLFMVFLLVLLTSVVSERYMFFPIKIENALVPVQYLLSPLLLLFLSRPLIEAIRDESRQVYVYEKFRKMGLLVFVLLTASSTVISAYSSVSHQYGDNEWGDYILRLEMRTVIAGPENWSVAFIRFRDYDEANCYYLLLHRDGVLELTKIVSREQTFLAFVKTELSPHDWHGFEIILKGASIKVSVDDVQYISIMDGSLSKGRVSLRGYDNAKLAFYREVQVTPT